MKTSLVCALRNPRRKRHLSTCFFSGLAFKTTNVDFLSVAVRDSRGLTAPELFGSWTRWPRLPDVSLTQGQNPEWKPLMFLSSCQLCLPPLPPPSFLLLFLLVANPPPCLPLLHPSPPPYCFLPSGSFWFTLSFSPLCFPSDPVLHRNGNWHRAGPPSLWMGLVQNYVISLRMDVVCKVLRWNY